MKFELILQDNKKVILTKEEADSLTKELLNVAKDRQEIFKMGVNVFKRTAIKGIFPVSEDVADNKEAWTRENKEWDDTCLKMSQYPVEQKVNIELESRIDPGLKFANIEMPIQLLEPMVANIRQFFIDNPKYPRCPMRVWWPFIRAKIAPINKKTNNRPNPTISYAKWFEVIARSDGAIEEWLKYQR